MYCNWIGSAFATPFGLFNSYIRRKKEKSGLVNFQALAVMYHSVN